MIKELTYGAYGSDNNWWDHSDAEAVVCEDCITISNVDNNASYSAIDVANAALGGKYSAYTAKDYADLFENGVDIAALVREALSKDKKTLGKTNHGLFSNRIKVDSQSTKISFTVKFLEAGGFVEISNNTGYGPYINTDEGTISVNTGYSNSVLADNMSTDKWYTFELILHDGRKNNPVATGEVALYDEAGNKLGKVDGLRLEYGEVEWYKVNFFPNSRFGAKMNLKNFTIDEYFDTPKVEPQSEKEAYIIPESNIAGDTAETDKSAEEEIVVPHVIDLLPETGVLRDPMVLNAPDGYYYMCCSTGTAPENARGECFPREDISDENLWKDDTGIRIWRSSDLVDWIPVKSAKKDSEYPYYIWNVYEGGTWEKVNGFGVRNINNGEKRFAQVLWAPEIHWVKGTYFVVYCMNPGGTAIARSVSGKPEGPYVRQECCQNIRLRARIDASLFWDDDNEVYYTDGSCAIARMNSDMSGIAIRPDGTEECIPSQAPGKEGGYLFKHNGIYYATAALFDDIEGYNSIIGMNKTGKCMENGSYKEAHCLYTLGHNGYFEDKEGYWWATMFGNDFDPRANEVNGFINGFALIPIDFDARTGKVIIDFERLDSWNDKLQKRGHFFAK